MCIHLDQILYKIPTCAFVTPTLVANAPPLNSWNNFKSRDRWKVLKYSMHVMYGATFTLEWLKVWRRRIKRPNNFLTPRSTQSMKATKKSGNRGLAAAYLFIYSAFDMLEYIVCMYVCNFWRCFSETGGPWLCTSVSKGDFWAWPVKILVFPSPTGSMLWSFGFSILIPRMFFKFP